MKKRCAARIIHALSLMLFATACGGARRDYSEGPARLELGDAAGCEVEGEWDAVPQRVRRVMCKGMRPVELEDALLVDAAVDTPRPVEAAFAIVLCVSSGRCEPEDAKPRRGRLSSSYGLLATLHHAATTVTPEALAQDLAREAIDRELASAFVERYAACRTTVLEAVADLGPRFEEVYVAPLAEARRRWRADLASAEQIARYEALKVETERALLDGSVTPALRDELDQLRREVVDACRARQRTIEYCLGLPIARPLSFDLVRLHIALGDGLAATAEARTGATAPDRSEIAYELHLTADAALAAERARHVAWRNAVEHRAAPAHLVATFGEHPPLDVHDRSNGVGVAPPQGEEFESALSAFFGTVHRVTDEVESVTRANGAAVLRWKAETHRYTEATDCRETRKVHRISADGDIIDRQRCTGPTVVKTDVKRLPDVRLPLAEARTIRTGDVVEVAVRKHDAAARVIKAYHPGRDTERGAVKQLGAFAVSP